MSAGASDEGRLFFAFGPARRGRHGFTTKGRTAMQNESQHIQIERPAEYVLQIRMVRREKRNALNNAMVLKIGETLAATNDDESVRVAIITGVDEAFCAGADIAEMRGTGGRAVNDPKRVKAWRSI